MTNIESGNDQQPAVRAKYGSSRRRQGKTRILPTAVSPATRIFVPDGRVDVPGGAQSLKAGEFYALAVAQDSAQPLEVGRHYRQRHRAGKSPAAMVAHPVQPAVFQMIDRRLNARVPLTGVLEPRLRLMRQNPGAQATLARQCTFIQQLTQISLIGRRVKAAVETAVMQVRESLPGFGYHRHRMVGIASAPHDAMLQDKLVLVLHHTTVRRVPATRLPCLWQSSGYAAQRSKTPSRRGQCSHLEAGGV